MAVASSLHCCRSRLSYIHRSWRKDVAEERSIAGNPMGPSERKEDGDIRDIHDILGHRPWPSSLGADSAGRQRAQ